MELLGAKHTAPPHLRGPPSHKGAPRKVEIVSLWSDAGPHFRSETFLQYALVTMAARHGRHRWKEVRANRFVERHGPGGRRGQGRATASAGCQGKARARPFGAWTQQRTVLGGVHERLRSTRVTAGGTPRVRAAGGRAGGGLESGHACSARQIPARQPLPPPPPVPPQVHAQAPRGHKGAVRRGDAGRARAEEGGEGGDGAEQAMCDVEHGLVRLPRGQARPRGRAPPPPLPRPDAHVLRLRADGRPDGHPTTKNTGGKASGAMPERPPPGSRAEVRGARKTLYNHVWSDVHDAEHTAPLDSKPAPPIKRVIQATQRGRRRSQHPLGRAAQILDQRLQKCTPPATRTFRAASHFLLPGANAMFSPS